MRTPGLEPIVRDNFSRENPAGKIDNFRDNWWDLSDPGQKEWQRLQAAALRAPDCLCRETVL